MTFNNKNNPLILILMIASGSASGSVSNDNDGYTFEPSLLNGSSLNIDFARFNNNGKSIPQGVYVVDLYLNGRMIKNKVPITFISTENNQEIEPCLSNDTLNMLPLKEKQYIKKDNNECIPFNSLSSTSSWEFNQSNLNLNLYLSQVELKKEPRGFIPIDEWDEGITALYLKHNTNYYESKQKNNKNKYLWSSINSGINLGLWQFRNISNLRYTSSNHNSDSHEFSNVRTYISRPIPSLESVLSIGSINTSSSTFSSLYFNGVKLTNDNRMKPQSLQGYAPVVRGVANSTAKVTIKQMGNIIYENVVSPGPFSIDDLNNTRGSGDYYVTVTEADGSTTSFIVPYSSVPSSVRSGELNYELSVGEVRDFNDSHFIDFAFNKGINNALTMNTGTRIAKNYGSLLLGGVVSGEPGAFGLNTTVSQTRLKDETKNGWRADISYSKGFDSGTDITLAAYRYSSEDFRDLYDYLVEKNNEQNNNKYDYLNINQKNRFSFNISQEMSDFGNLAFNASLVDYYSGRRKETEYQVSYSNSVGNIYYSINATRQAIRTVNYDGEVSELTGNEKENTIGINFSIPFNNSKKISSVNFNYSKNKNSSSANTSVSGNLSNDNNLSYSVYAGHNRQKNSSDTTTYGASLNSLTSLGSYRASYSSGNNYDQYSLGTSGTLVIHSEGLTYGPYVSDTFALVKAEGANGAKLSNSNGAQINRFGYAIAPSLTPYRYNNIGLNPDGMSNNTDLDGGSKQIVPYSGSIAKVEFKTISGRAVLIKTNYNNNEDIPMGADVTNQQGESIGMVGQGGVIYGRVKENKGTFSVKWTGTEPHECIINYEINNNDQSITRLTLPCVKK